MRLARALLPALVALTAACSDSTGPGDLGFPNLSAQVEASYCVRDYLTTGDSRSGSITENDCDVADVSNGAAQGYYDTFLLRVRGARAVTLSVESVFDSYLSLLRLDGHSATVLTLTLVGEDDDSNGNLDARLTATLQPGVTYVVAVSGFDYAETGAYRLDVR